MPALTPLFPRWQTGIWFKNKIWTLNSQFAAQCTLVKNASTLPKFKCRTNNSINSFTVNKMNFVFNYRKS